MNILITGASGFIGSQVVAALLAKNHQVTCCTRHIEKIKSQFPNCEIIDGDFNQDVRKADWLPRLKNIDAVVNCAGILKSTRHNDIEAVHEYGPCALFSACKEAQVNKIIQISALGASPNAATIYGRSKNAADEHLLSLDLNTIILRPSLIYGRGFTGGAILFRGLAAIPFVTPLVGDGEQVFQPTYSEDLVKAIVYFLEQPHLPNKILNAVGPKVITMRSMILALRQWLGLGKSLIIKTPIFLIRIAAKFGNYLGNFPLNSTAIKMLLTTQSVDPKPFQQSIPFQLKTFKNIIEAYPAQPKDKRDARLYFIKLPFTMFKS